MIEGAQRASIATHLREAGSTKHAFCADWRGGTRVPGGGSGYRGSDMPLSQFTLQNQDYGGYNDGSTNLRQISTSECGIAARLGAVDFGRIVDDLVPIL